MLDSQLLKALENRSSYERYAPIVKGQAVLAETATIVKDIGAWFEAHPEEETIKWGPFTAWARITLHPTWKREQVEIYERIIQVAEVSPLDPSVLDRFVSVRYAQDLIEKAEEIKNGKGTWDQVEAILSAYNSEQSREKDADSIVKADVPTLLSSVSITGGMEWRLEDLNRSVGPLHKGDLVIVGKRPEVGGTTFITSEFTYMAGQLDEGKHAIIFNNEESGTKVALRLVQSALGLSVWDLASDPAKAQADYAKFLGTKRIDVYHNTGLSTNEVERVLKSGEYGLIAFNVLDKLRGFHKLEGVERLRAIAQWARVMADKYGVVFAVAQADASAEGAKWLDQSQLYGSKTGMQGEADVLLMIGRDPMVDDERYFSIAKNKKPGGARTNRALRHGHLTVRFDGEVGLFDSLVYPDRTV